MTDAWLQRVVEDLQEAAAAGDEAELLAVAMPTPPGTAGAEGLGVTPTPLAAVLGGAPAGRPSPPMALS